MNRRTLFSWVVVLTTSMLLTGCGLSSSDDDDDETSTAKVRLVNLTSASDLLLTVDDSAEITSVGNGTASAYTTLDVDTYSVVVSSASAALSASGTGSLALAADTDYTVVAYERGGLIKFFTRTDETEDPSAGFAYFTVINAGSDAGSLDVFVVAPGADISELTPTFASVASASSSLTNAISAGTYDIIVTASNKPSDVRLSLPSVTLSDADILSFTLTSTAGGALVNGALIQQGGEVAVYRANKARVRVVAAFAAGSNSNWQVHTSVAGEDLSAVTAPSVGNYELVMAEAGNYDVMVGETAVSVLPETVFASGGDYTVLVYGSDASDAAVTVLTDNNQLPSSGAKIRLVNGAVAVAGLSLSANYANLFSEIAFGNSSVYSGITAGTTRLDLTSPALAFSSYNSSVSILTGGVYSLLVLGDTENAIVLLNKDR